MGARGYTGRGVLFQLQEPHVEYDPDDDDTLPEATDFVTISRVKSVGRSGETVEKHDVTAIDSDSNVADYIPGLDEGGEVSLVLNFRPEESTFQLIEALAKSHAERHWRILCDPLPGKPARAFTGFVVGIEGPNVTPRQVMERTVKIQVTAPSAAEEPKPYDTDP